MNSTLTKELQSAKSPVTKVIKDATPGLTGGRKATSLLRVSYPFALVIPRTASPYMGATIGTAFDYLIRLQLPDFSLEETIAFKSVQLLTEFKEFEVYASTAVSLYREIASLLQNGNSSDLPKIALSLAELDSLYRGGPIALDYKLGDRLISADDGKSFIAQLEKELLEDFTNLSTANSTLSMIDALKLKVISGDIYLGNPIFGRGWVGADGDWIIGKTLYELKTVNNLDHSKLSTYIRQAIGYVLLDVEDKYKLNSIAIMLPRFNLLLRFNLNDLLFGGISSLPDWRTKMEAVLKENPYIGNLTNS